MTHKTPPAATGLGKKPRRRGAPHITALFWALWLLAFTAYVVWQTSH